jgi:L-xylulokinase
MMDVARFVLGIDAGGTAVKAGVYGLDGEERGLASRVLRPITPAPGHAERNPEVLWRSVCEVIRAVLADAALGPGDVETVGITGYGNGIYLLDPSGQPLANGLLSSDVRAARLVADWRSRGLEAEAIERVGKPFWPGSSLCVLGWFRQHRPDVLAAAAAAVPCKDYLRSRLVGRIAAETTDQSTASLLSNASRERDPRVLSLVDLEDVERLMPELIEPLAIAGTVTRRAATETGLSEGIPVSAGCCDNMAVMYGTGAVGSGEVVVMSGTWGLQQVILDHMPAGGRIGFVNHAAVPGQWLCFEGSPASASSFEWFVETFLRGHGVDAPAAAAYELANTALTSTAPDGPPVFFLPFLNGAFDEVDARGSLVGLSTWHGLGHVVRAVYEGVAFEHRRHLERLLTVCERLESAQFAGGPARSRAWSEIFAAALGLKLRVPRGAEFGARGAAILAAVACGMVPDVGSAVRSMTSLSHIVEPSRHLREALDQRFTRYCELHSALRAFWRA